MARFRVHILCVVALLLFLTPASYGGISKRAWKKFKILVSSPYASDREEGVALLDGADQDKTSKYMVRLLVIETDEKVIEATFKIMATFTEESLFPLSSRRRSSARTWTNVPST